MECEVKPSPAASALLKTLALPPGTVAVWPTTRDGQIKLVVKLDQRYWLESKKFPSMFEGFSVIVEPYQSLPAQTSFRGIGLH